MEIDKTIEKWFEETKAILAKKKCSEDERFYKLCLNIIRIVKNYCKASLILLDNNRKRPAMALLRIQIELAAKFSWLINGKRENEFDVRLKKWENKTLSDRLKLRKDALEALPKDERGREEKLNQIAEQVLKTTDLKCMPQDRQLVEEMFSNEESVLHGVGLYRQFHSAVHPDILVIEAVESQMPEETVEGDYGPKIEDLKLHSLVNFAWTIKPIYEYYDMDFEREVGSEVKKLVQSKK